MTAAQRMALYALALVALACDVAGADLAESDMQNLLQVYSELSKTYVARSQPARQEPVHPPGSAAARASGMPLNSARPGGSDAVKIACVVIALVLPTVAFICQHFINEKRKRDLEISGEPRSAGLERQFSDDGSISSGPGEVQPDIVGSKSFRNVEREDAGDFSMTAVFSMPENSQGHIRNFLCGATITLNCLPEAVSFSLIVGLSPLNGIWAGVFMGLYASLLGGRPGMISCSSAATAVVLENLRQTHGMGAMGLCVIICGLLELLAGVLYFTRFVALVPHTVMIGFVNGLAIVTARSQLGQFRLGHDGPYVDEHTMWGMILTVCVSMFGATVFPRIPRIGKALPGPLVGVVCAVLFGLAIHPYFPIRTLIDVAGPVTFAGGMNSIPAWNFPPGGVNWQDARMWSSVIMTAIRMALVGLLESTLTAKLIDQLTCTQGSTRRECFGQGLGNVVAGCFGTQGGCALIGQSLINIGGGGHGRLSGFTMSMGMAASVLLLAPVVGHVPVAALVGLMFLVALNTFAWGSLGILHVIDPVDLIVIITVTVVTLMVDLATAVLAGLFISALGFAWSAASDVRVDEDTDGDETRTFALRGPLFFGSAMNYQNLIKPERIPEKNVVLDFSRGKVLDHSALDAISKTVDRLSEAGKTTRITSLHDEAVGHLRSIGSKAAEHASESKAAQKTK